MSDYLLNAWYVAAWSEDVTSKPLSRRLLDMPVALYRGADGRAVALHDRCPHRFAPLSTGKVIGTMIQCGYHGLQIESDGRCVDTRLTSAACKAAQVRSLPLVERDSIVWIWMGDPGRADPAQIGDFSFLVDERRASLRGTTFVKANYLLEVDNLLDLSHLDHVHLGSIANGGLTTGQYTWRQEGDTIHTCWDSPNVPIPPQFMAHMPGVELVDQWTDFRWDAPASLFLYNGATRVGQPREAGVEVWQGHFVTPQTQTTCVYFWSMAQKKQHLPDALVESTRSIVRRVFEEEDRPMIEAQQATMRGVDLWAEKPVFFAEDAGAVRARKVLERRIREERAT